MAADRFAELAPGQAERLADGAARMVQGRLMVAYRRLLEDLAADAREGGQGVGIGQYPGGTDCYAGLIRLHTGLDLAADEVHAIGLAEVERITAGIRDELGITDEPGCRRRSSHCRKNSGDPARSPSCWSPMTAIANRAQRTGDLRNGHLTIRNRAGHTGT